MSASNLLGNIVCSYFKQSPGIFQYKKEKQQGLLLQVKTTINYKEEGYRYKDLFLYASSNYVGVYTRDRWNVIPLEDLEHDAHGDTYVKVGRSYVKGCTTWSMLTYHSSCWEDAVRRFFSENEHSLLTLDCLSMSDFPLQIVEVGASDRYSGFIATPTHKEMAVAKKEKYANF